MRVCDEMLMSSEYLVYTMPLLNADLIFSSMGRMILLAIAGEQGLPKVKWFWKVDAAVKKSISSSESLWVLELDFTLSEEKKSRTILSVHE